MITTEHLPAETSDRGSDCADFRIAITEFPSLTVAYGRRVELSLRELADSARSPRRYPVESLRRKVDGSGLFEKPFDLEGFSCATYRGDHRCKDDLEQATALGLDLERAEFDFADAVSALTAVGLTAVLYTSFNHSKHAPRLRVIVPLSRPVTTDEYTILFATVAGVVEESGGRVDPSAKDGSRFWFAPAVPDGAEYQSTLVRGSPLDVDRILTEASAKAAASQRVTSPATRVPLNGGRRDRYAAGALRSACETIRSAVEGTRNATLNKEAFSLAGYVAAGELDEQHVRSQLTEAAAFAGLATLEIRATIESGFRAGAQQPRRIEIAESPDGSSPPDDLPPPSADDEPLEVEVEDLGPEASDNVDVGDNPRSGSGDGHQDPLTDSGNAERFARLAVGRLVFCRTGYWLFWAAKRWERDDAEIRALRCAKAVARVIYREAGAVTRGDDRDKMLRHWARSEDLARQRAMIKLATREPRMSIAPDALDGDTWLLNVANGTVDLRTGRLREHTPADRITRLCRVKYGPAAPCPRFELFLQEIFAGDQDLIGFVQRLVGYGLTGETTIHGIFFFWGDGSNGKTTFVETVLELLGDYAHVCSPDVVLESRGGDDNLRAANKAELFRRRLVFMQETKKRRSLDEAFVKAATGGDRISACRKYENPFTFDPTHKLILSTNHKPRISGTDFGIWRRIYLVPFTQKFEPGRNADVNLKRKLKDEFPGILRWAVEGCLAWQKEGLCPPASVQNAVREYQAEEDVIGRFIKECCTLGEGHWTTSSTLSAALETWGREEGRRDLRIDDLRARLRENECTPDTRKRDGKQERGWKGVSVECSPSVGGDAANRAESR